MDATDYADELIESIILALLISSGMMISGQWLFEDWIVWDVAKWMRWSLIFVVTGLLLFVMQIVSTAMQRKGIVQISYPSAKWWGALIGWVVGALMGVAIIHDLG